MKNLKISQRMAAGFAAVILLAVALGTFAYTRVGAIDTNATNMAEHRLPTIYLLGEVQNHAQSNVGLVLRHISATDPREMAAITAEVRDRATKNTSLLQQFEKLITTDKGRALFEEIGKARAPMAEARDEAIALSGSGKKSEAAALFESRMLAANAKYMEAVAN